MAEWSVVPVNAGPVPEDDLDARAKGLDDAPEEHRADMKAEIERQRQQRKTVQRVTLEVRSGKRVMLTRDVDVKSEAALRQRASELLREVQNGEPGPDLSALVGQEL